MMGPYSVVGRNLSYVGNKIKPPLKEVRNINPPDLSERYKKLTIEKEWKEIIKLYDAIHFATTKFMRKEGVFLFDLPITTRMISSPGALTGTIISDVKPFRIDMFNNKMFLTQSSQLYLEFAIMAPEINSVYCWEKSFRREKADFRHLPEFLHIEFESNINFEKNLKFQEKYYKYLIKYILKNYKDSLFFFLTNKDIKELKQIINTNFKRITFHEVFEKLYENTKNKKYKKISIKNFGAYEEVLLTDIVGGKPIFVTHYIADEVAFYHQNDKKECHLAINADLLVPGYGEVIGSGERVHTLEEVKQKAKYFKLNLDDYEAYINSRSLKGSQIHSGWGMGIERFLQALLKMPFIWDVKIFPRLHNYKTP